jgi:hypothetical protein
MPDVGPEKQGLVLQFRIATRRAGQPGRSVLAAFLKKVAIDRLDSVG